MAELSAFNNKTMYLEWNLIIPEIGLDGKGLLLLGSMYKCKELLRSVFWFVQKLTIRCKSTTSTSKFWLRPNHIILTLGEPVRAIRAMIKPSQRKFVFLIWSKIVRDSSLWNWPFSLVFTRHKEGSGPLQPWLSPTQGERTWVLEGSDVDVVFKNPYYIANFEISWYDGIQLSMACQGPSCYVSGHSPTSETCKNFVFRIVG